MIGRAARLGGALLIALSLAIAGCSSSGGDAPAGNGTGTTTTGTTTTGTTTAGSTPTSTQDGGTTTTGSSPDPTATGSGTDAKLSGTLTIFAAASLKKAFDQLRTEFMAANPGVDVRPITYDGSPTLVTQLVGGASADVFASADQANMQNLVTAGLVAGTPENFTTNTLEIAVAPGNPKKITALASLAQPGLLVVLCAPKVPCGAAAHKALDAAGVTVNPASEEQNVTAVLTKVETGDADAGIVYRTDVAAAQGKVTGVDFPEASAAVNTYPIAVVKGAANPAAAQAFSAFVRSPAGQKVLTGLGFGPP